MRALAADGRRTRGSAKHFSLGMAPKSHLASASRRSNGRRRNLKPLQRGVVDGSQNETECAGSLPLVWIRGRRRFRDVLKTRLYALAIDHEGLSVAPRIGKPKEPKAGS